MPSVNVHAAEAHLLRLLAEVEAGGEALIARGGKPVTRLVPVEPPVNPKRQPGTLKGKIALTDTFFEPLAEDELRLWRRCRSSVANRRVKN